MTRRAFGGGSADFVSDSRGNTRSGGTGLVYRDQEKTDRVTDLLDVDGTPISTVYAKTSPKGMVQFQGPDDGTAVLWCEFGDGAVKMVASDGVVAAENVPDLSASYATQAQRTALSAADAAHAALTAAHGATGAVVGTTNTQTLTGKTVAFGSNTVSGTRAQFNTAMTDDDFATLTGSETLTNKTLTAPAMTAPTATGSLTGFGGAWTAYTPTWGASSAPSLGNGTITGAYVQIGKLVIGRFKLVIGSTSTLGTGAWSITPPVAPIAGSDELPAGTGKAYDAGVQHYARTLYLSSSVLYGVGPTGEFVTSVAPHAWNTGDVWLGSFTYEAA